MDAEKKRRLKSEYKAKLPVGAVYCIECSGNNHRLIKSTPDINGIKNRFNFAIASNSCPDPSLIADWKEYGTESFSLIVLEELKQEEAQTSREFADDVKTLQELWVEKEGQSTVKIGQFLDETGKIVQLPTKHKSRRVVLEYLATKFDSETSYTERQVNDICDAWHTFNDYFILRRELVEEGLLNREKDGSKYWRNNGE